jgi:hypothetical protein
MALTKVSGDLLESALTIPSGSSIVIESGGTITNSGTATGFGVSNDFVTVRLDVDQSITRNTITKIQYDTEVFDANGWFDSTTNYRFQPDVSGHYLVIAIIGYGNQGDSLDMMAGYIYKNGAEHIAQETLYRGSYTNNFCLSGVVQLNGSSDYIEIYTRNGTTNTPVLEKDNFNTTTNTNNMMTIARLT